MSSKEKNNMIYLERERELLQQMQKQQGLLAPSDLCDSNFQNKGMSHSTTSVEKGIPKENCNNKYDHEIKKKGISKNEK